MGIHKVQGNASLCSYDLLSTSDRGIETTSRVGRLSKKTTKTTTPNLNFKVQQVIFKISIFHTIFGKSSPRIYSPRLIQSSLGWVLTITEGRHRYLVHRISAGETGCLPVFLQESCQFCPWGEEWQFPPSLIATAWTSLIHKWDSHFSDPLITHLLKKKWKCSLIQVTMLIKWRSMCKA